MTSATERLLYYIDYKGDTKYKFYKKTGLSNGFLDKNRNIGSDKCEIISENYPDLSLEWLITGNGEMLKNNDIITQTTTGNNNISIGKGNIKGSNSINLNNDTIKQLGKELQDCKNSWKTIKKMIAEKDNQTE